MSFRRAAAPVAACASFATIVACGSFLAAPDRIADDAGITNDGSTDTSTEDDAGADVTTADGSFDVAPPRTPPTCFESECPGSLPPDDCKDYQCGAGDTDFVREGNVTGNGQCLAATSTMSPSLVSQTRPRRTPRRYAGLSFRLDSATVPDRAIASIAIEGAPDGERFVAVARAGQLLLCERNQAAEVCTGGVPLSRALGKRIHLYGVVAPSGPAAFSLSIEACTDTQTLAAGSAFASTGDVRGSVGCLESTQTPCTMGFDEVVLFTAPE